MIRRFLFTTALFLGPTAAFPLEEIILDTDGTTAVTAPEKEKNDLHRGGCAPPSHHHRHRDSLDSRVRSACDAFGPEAEDDGCEVLLKPARDYDRHAEADAEGWVSFRFADARGRTHTIRWSRAAARAKTAADAADAQEQ